MDSVWRSERIDASHGLAHFRFSRNRSDGQHLNGWVARWLSFMIGLCINPIASDICDKTTIGPDLKGVC